MAKLLGNLVKLDNGQLITPQTGAWYDGQQYWNGVLSQPGQINPNSNQPGAGGLVSKEVIAQTNPANVAYIDAQRAKAGLTPSPTTGVPSSTPSTTPSTPATGGGTAIPSYSPTSAINLPDIYKNLYESSGISLKEADLTAKEKQYLEARNKISDNPFLNASMVDKRLARLQAKYEAETAPTRSEIATKKADIETQLNLQTKQFDINSQSAKDALNYFNTLLEAGALNNATGEDIANLTRSTGLSSTIIQSAIDVKKNKNDKTQVITSTADNGTVTATVINSETGAIIKQTSLGKVGNAESGGGVSETEAKQLIVNDLRKEASKGVTWDDLYNMGLGYVDPLLIYQIYLGANYYKPTDAQKKADLQRYGISTTNFQTTY